MCLEEIGLRAQKMLTILGSLVNVNGRELYDQVMNMKIYILIMNKVFIRVPKSVRLMTMGTIQIC